MLPGASKVDLVQGEAVVRSESVVSNTWKPLEMRWPITEELGEASANWILSAKPLT